ncbi:MAG: DUF2075 domain-containing protein [Alistipes sp.]|nr:DUF2075 domain-containing protein [Alistipes sp.]
MKTIQQCVHYLVDNGRLFLEQEKNNRRNEYDCAKSQFCEYMERYRDIAAIQDWGEVSSTPKEVVFPPFIKYGEIEIPKSAIFTKNESIPFLLPTNVNAALFNFGTNKDIVPNIFKNIIFRLLLTMRIDLLKVSIINRDFGASYRQISMISNSSFKCNLISDFTGISKLIEELAQEIGTVNKNLLGDYDSIDELNNAERTKPHPYHVVIIDDFPNIIPEQYLQDLFRIIDKGNANKAGIKVFINYCEDTSGDNKFNIQNFLNICASITYNKTGLTILNWGQSYTSSKLNIKIEDSFTDKYNSYVNFLNGIKNNYSLDNWAESHLSSSTVWTGNTSDGINIPVGFISPTKTFDFYLANDNDSTCNDFFALIAGRPGYGKTVFLHNIITNAAIKYSPEDLVMYLADFKEGAGFSIYRDLPHVKSIMLTNNKEYALRMLQDVVAEAKRRSQLYQQAQNKYGQQVSSLSSYRKITKEALPRILFIIDEFHYLFLSKDATTLEAKETLCNGIRQWRQFGISIILSTQSINDVNFGSSDNQITYRIAFNLLSQDSRSVIRNDLATKLTDKGQAILNNTADGSIEANIEFKSAYTTKYYDHVIRLRDLYVQKYGHKAPRPFICEANSATYIADNDELISHLVNNDFAVGQEKSYVYIGRPDLLRISHTKLCYKRQLNSNTIILGEDLATLVRTVMVQLVQLHKQSHPDSYFYIIDCINRGDKYDGVFDSMSQYIKNCVVSRNVNLIDTIFNEFKHRKELQQNGELIDSRIFLTILNIQNCYDLKSDSGIFSSQSVVQKQLSSIIEEGPNLGIHCIIHGLNYNMVFVQSNILSSRLFSSFENKIFLKGADIKNAIYNFPISSVEEDGQMVVKFGSEKYEQCSAYRGVYREDVNEQNNTLSYMSQLFAIVNQKEEE